MNFEREFLNLGAIYLACRLAVMGGTPLIPQHQPVKDFNSLGWTMLGCVDYAFEMRLLCRETLALRKPQRPVAPSGGGGVVRHPIRLDRPLITRYLSVTDAFKKAPTPASGLQKVFRYLPTQTEVAGLLLLGLPPFRMEG